MKTSYEIKIAMPKKVYARYIKDAGGVNEDGLTETQVKKIFTYAVDGFQRGDLSTDGLAAICHQLFRLVIKLPGDDQNLLDAIIAGSELSYYVRQPALLKQFCGFLQTVVSYRETLG